MTARQFSIYTEAPAGGGRIYLDSLGYISGLTWSHTWPGGPSSLAVNLQTAYDLQSPGLLAGRRIIILSGGTTVWRGTMDPPKRGNPWTVSAVGIGAAAKTFAAIYGGGVFADSVVDNAISRGMPWTRPNSLGGPSSALSTGTEQVDAALTGVAQTLGQVWAVTPNGVVSMAAPPTAPPTYILATGEAIEGSLLGYFTQVCAIYLSGSTPSAVTVTDPIAAARYGYIEPPQALDLTGYGSISSGSATVLATNYLSLNSSRLRTTTPLAVSQGQLMSPAGTPFDLAMVQAGCLVRLQQTVIGSETLASPTNPLDLLIGETSYDADTDTLTLTPVGDARDDILGLLYQGAGGNF